MSAISFISNSVIISFSAAGVKPLKNKSLDIDEAVICYIVFCKCLNSPLYKSKSEMTVETGTYCIFLPGAQYQVILALILQYKTVIGST